VICIDLLVAHAYHSLEELKVRGLICHKFKIWGCVKTLPHYYNWKIVFIILLFHVGNVNILVYL
jgi:hypothetical protein